MKKKFFSFPNNKSVIHYDIFLCSRYEDGECEQFWKHLNENIKPDTKMNRYCKDILLQFDSTKNISITINEELHKINVFVNKTNFSSEFKIYYYNDESYFLEKEYTIYHIYKVAYGDFDEKNNRILLGVAGFEPNGIQFIGWEKIGTKYIKIKE